MTSIDAYSPMFNGHVVLEFPGEVVSGPVGETVYGPFEPQEFSLNVQPPEEDSPAEMVDVESVIREHQQRLNSMTPRQRLSSAMSMSPPLRADMQSIFGVDVAERLATLPPNQTVSILWPQ